MSAHRCFRYSLMSSTSCCITSLNNVSKQSNAVDVTPKLGAVTPGVFEGKIKKQLWVSSPTVCVHTTGGVGKRRTGPLGLAAGLVDVEEDNEVAAVASPAGDGEECPGADELDCPASSVSANGDEEPELATAD